MVDDSELKYKGRFPTSSLTTPKLPLSHITESVEDVALCYSCREGLGEGDGFISEWFILTASGFYF